MQGLALGLKVQGNKDQGIDFRVRIQATLRGKISRITVIGSEELGWTFRLGTSAYQLDPAANILDGIFKVEGSGVTMGWLLRLVTGAPLVVRGPRQFQSSQ